MAHGLVAAWENLGGDGVVRADQRTIDQKRLHQVELQLKRPKVEWGFRLGSLANIEVVVNKTVGEARIQGINSPDRGAYCCGFRQVREVKEDEVV